MRKVTLYSLLFQKTKPSTEKKNGQVKVYACEVTVQVTVCPTFFVNFFIIHLNFEMMVCNIAIYFPSLSPTNTIFSYK